jgi:hypothetical protein
MSDVKIPEDLRKLAREIISTESICIEWGATAERSVELAAEKIHAFVQDRIAALEAENARLQGSGDDYIAWLRWGGENFRRYLVLCDSDSEGAFKVFRRPLDVQDQSKLVERWNITNKERNAEIEQLVQENAALKAQVETSARLFTNLAQIIDVVKQEWGESWSVWDQEQRDSITAWLISYYAARASQK